MSTNYYAVEKSYKLNREILHIGKSSLGWKFCFRGHIQARHGDILNLEDWKNYIKDNDMLIFDEYSRLMSFDKFFCMIEELQKQDNIDDFKHDANIGGYRFCFTEFC